MKEKKVGTFSCKQPCNNCPYRTDAPVRYWHKSEFKKVLVNESELIGHAFYCHKQNGSICIGFLIEQDKRGLPCLALRILLGKYNIDREYLESLHSPAPLYESIEEMIRANFPELLKTKKIKE